MVCSPCATGSTIPLRRKVPKEISPVIRQTAGRCTPSIRDRTGFEPANHTLTGRFCSTQAAVSDTQCYLVCKTILLWMRITKRQGRIWTYKRLTRNALSCCFRASAFPIKLPVLLHPAIQEYAGLVATTGFEPVCLSTTDFKSVASTVPPCCQVGWSYLALLLFAIEFLHPRTHRIRYATLCLSLE